MKCLALLLLAIIPVETVLVDQCDVLLYERFYTADGRMMFIQLCPLDWNPHAGRWDYVAFRLEKHCGQLKPERDWQRGGWVVRFMDDGTPRIIRATSMRDEWVQVDSEVAAREVCPKENRKQLRHPTAARPR